VVALTIPEAWQDAPGGLNGPLVLGVPTYSLFGGVALYLGGQLLFKRRIHNLLSLPRLVAICVLLAALPAAAVLPSLVGLTGLPRRHDSPGSRRAR
jgi:hypothetical protein